MTDKKYIFRAFGIRRIFSLFFFCFMTVTFSYGQKVPDWVLNNGKSMRYSDRTFLTGIAFTEANDSMDEDAIELATEGAKGNLSEKVLQNITSVTTTSVTEENDEYSDMINMEIESMTTLDIVGLNVETPYFDKKNDRLFVLVYAEREGIKKLYTHNWESTNLKLTETFKEGEYFEENDKANAIKRFDHCKMLIAERDKFAKILICLGGEVQNSKDDITGLLITKKINAIQNMKISNLDDLIFSIIQTFENLTDAPLQGVTVGAPLFGKHRVKTDLSIELQNRLELNMMNKRSWKITAFDEWKNLNPEDPEILNKLRYTVHSNYQIVDKSITFRSDIFDMLKNKNIARFYQKFDVEVFEKTGISYAPSGYFEIKNDLDMIGFNKVKPSALKIDFNTNKGAETPQFIEGDELKLTYRTNYPAYIRIIYHMANGTRILLVDNDYISESKVNQVIHYPKSFICAPPFGIEIMQINAQTEPFEELNTKVIGAGYKLITDDLKKILETNRNSNKNSRATIMQTEKSIIFNTMKRQ